MFKKLFSRKTKAEKLQIEYRRLLEEAYKLSTVNRLESYMKENEANKILEEIDALKKEGE